jgi:23S rRNA (cytosine1962-C5)-methyltransferase
MASPRDKKSGRTGRKGAPGKNERSRGNRASSAGGRKRGASRGPERRTGGVKVPTHAARLLRAGHPWVFRDAVRRSLEGIAAGTVVRVADEDGLHVGFAIVEPEGVVAARMLSLADELEWTSEEIRRRVGTAIAYRDQWLDTAHLSAYRLIHGDSDGFPGLAVDRLGDYLLIYQYARSVDGYLEHVVEALGELEPRGIYLQDRARPVSADDKRPPGTLVTGKLAPPEFEVEEDGLRFLVDVTAPVSPGLFVDLRDGRRLFETLAPEKNVLNLFSFTGAFGLRAVRAGAASVTNVDAAARSHARCRQNLAASGLDPEGCDAVTGDVFKHLEKYRFRGRTFDLVVVDPPPFSTVKGTTFSALRDWTDLMRAVCGVVAPGGQVLAVCNAAKLTDAEFLLALGEGASAAGRRALLVGESGLPVDFPVVPAFTEGRYLKVKLLYVA